jgi:hypothetical protein
MAAGAWRLASIVAILASAPSGAEGVDWSGYASLEPRIFMHGAGFAGQSDAAVSPSAVLAPELRLEWHEGDDRLTLAPWFRWDAGDDERTHADLREANWLHVRGSWSWRVGLGRVFWGVTESRHLVDIINQTDQVEDLDEEDKLGQPMVAVERWTATAGTFGVFLLPGFRERTFPAADARLRGTLPVDTGRAEYESGAGDRHIDWALRWSHAIGRWDLGISGFHGTSREPRLLAAVDDAGRPVLIPSYDVISQLAADIQYTRGAWLWKLEAIGRRGHGEEFAAYVAGVEYTWFNLREAGADLGLLAEYLYDGRDDTAPPTIYEDDWFVAFRLGLNDPQGTAILGGAVVDSNGSLVVVEAERRVGDAWKIEAEVRWFVGVDANDPLLGGFRNDSFVTLRLSRYL